MACMKPKNYRIVTLLFMIMVCMGLGGCLGTIASTTGSVLFGANEEDLLPLEPYQGVETTDREETERDGTKQVS